MKSESGFSFAIASQPFDGHWSWGKTECNQLVVRQIPVHKQHKMSESDIKSQSSSWRPLANLFSVAVTHNFSCSVSRHLQRFLFEKYSKLYFVCQRPPTVINMDNVHWTSISPPPSLASSCNTFAQSMHGKMKSWYLLSHNRRLACTEQAPLWFDCRW